MSSLATYRTPISRYRPPPRRTDPPLPPRWTERERAPRSPAMAQFVVLSMLLHALAILLFGAPPGGSREGRAMWGSASPIQVFLQPFRAEPAPELKVERKLSLPPATRKRRATATPPPLALPAPLEHMVAPKSATTLETFRVPAPVELPPAALPAPMPSRPEPRAVELPRVEMPTLPEPPVPAPKIEIAPLPALPSTPPVELPAVELPPLPAPRVEAPVPPRSQAAPEAAREIPAAPVVAEPRPAPSPEPVAAPPAAAQPASPFRAPVPAAPAAQDAARPYDPAAPALDLDALRNRAGQIAREGSGNRAALPFPMPPVPKPKSKMESAIENARKPDCRTAYQNLGLAAIVPLIANEFGEGSCRW